MGKGLYKLGTFAFTRRLWIVIGWTIILTSLVVIMLRVGPKTSSELSIPGTPAQAALTRFEEIFPKTGAANGKLVLGTADGKTLADYGTEIQSLTEKIASRDDVTRAIAPSKQAGSISDDGTIGFVTVQLESSGATVSKDVIIEFEDIAAQASQNGLMVVPSGDLVSNEPRELLGVAEVFGLVLALVVLLVTFGSIVAAGMPLVTALVAVGASMAGLFSLSQVVDITSTAPVLAIMLGLAVGIDYSLFIINRYRTLVKEGYSPEKATGHAIATAGNAVIFAASTVVVALAALTVVQIPFMSVMGLSAAATVAVAALVAVTFVPALLGFVRYGIFSRRERRVLKAIQAKPHKIKHERVDHDTIWYRVGEFILRFRKTVLVLSLGVIVVLAWPINQLQLGLPTGATAAEGSVKRQAYDLLTKGFGEGYNAPLLVIAEGLPGTSDTDKAAVRAQIMQQVQAEQQGMQGAQQAPATIQAQQARLDGLVAQYAPYYQLQLVAKKIADRDDVSGAQAVLVTEDGTKGVIQVTPTSGPSSQATYDLVKQLRDTATARSLTGNATLAVTGTTALQLDINEKLTNALPVYLGVVVGISLLILLIAFRSVLIPIKATLGFLLSVFAMFGALTAVFQLGWFGIAEAPGPIVSFVPIIAIGILFGLAMDYEFFLVSGMQEAYHKSSKHRESILNGFALGSRVVVAAALIMVSVFAGFIGNHDTTIQSMGFALALGVFVDAFVVRMLIVPIAMSYLGKSTWWLPKWLDKNLLKVSIEGEEVK